MVMPKIVAIKKYFNLIVIAANSIPGKSLFSWLTERIRLELKLHLLLYAHFEITAFRADRV